MAPPLDRRARRYSLRDAEGLQHPAPAPPRVTFCLLRDKWPKEDFLQFLSNGKVPSGQVWKCPSKHRPMSPSARETSLGTPCLEIKVSLSLSAVSRAPHSCDIARMFYIPLALQSF